MSDQDPSTHALTGNTSPPLLTKEQWHAAVIEKVAQAKLRDDPLSVIFIDVNYFKHVNDTLGHLAGDEVLGKISELIDKVAGSFRTSPSSEPNQASRSLDLVSLSQFDSHLPPVDTGSDSLADLINTHNGRIGGDEFAILCETNQEGAQTIAQRIRQVFGEFLEQSENKNLRELGIGLAIGSSTLDADMEAKDLLEKADKAMYEDKLNQLPDLSERQRVALQAARLLLELNGIRLRDVHKYWRIHPEPSA